MVPLYYAFVSPISCTMFIYLEKIEYIYRRATMITKVLQTYEERLKELDMFGLGKR